MIKFYTYKKNKNYIQVPYLYSDWNSFIKDKKDCDYIFTTQLYLNEFKNNGISDLSNGEGTLKVMCNDKVSIIKKEKLFSGIIYEEKECEELKNGKSGDIDILKIPYNFNNKKIEKEKKAIEDYDRICELAKQKIKEYIIDRQGMITSQERLEGLFFSKMCEIFNEIENTPNFLEYLKE